MAVYQAPEGYHFDPQSGLYLKKLIVTDTDGIEYDHRIYFNDETGEYTQESFPLSDKAIGKVRNPKAMKRGIAIAAIALAVVIAVFFALSYQNRKYEAPYTLSDDELAEIYDRYSFDTIPDSVIELRDYEGVINEGGIIR